MLFRERDMTLPAMHLQKPRIISLLKSGFQILFGLSHELLKVLLVNALQHSTCLDSRCIIAGVPRGDVLHTDPGNGRTRAAGAVGENEGGPFAPGVVHERRIHRGFAGVNVYPLVPCEHLDPTLRNIYRELCLSLNAINAIFKTHFHKKNSSTLTWSSLSTTQRVV